MKKEKGTLSDLTELTPSLKAEIEKLIDEHVSAWRKGKTLRTDDSKKSNTPQTDDPKE